MTRKQEYLNAGLKLLPCGKVNDYAWQKHLGRVGSKKDFTWDREKKIHTCCGSKRDYYHKISCPAVRAMADDDYSDLKNI